MSVRDWMNSNPASTTVVAIVLLIGAIAFAVVRFRGGATPGRTDVQWFYELDSGDLIEVACHEISPIATEAGQAVKAQIYSCSSCGSDRRVAWIEKYDEKTRAKVVAWQEQVSGENRGGVQDGAALSRGRLISRVPEIKWVRMNSAAGRKIMVDAATLCGVDGKLKFCEP
jgi:hypothetical protein